MTGNLHAVLARVAVRGWIESNNSLVERLIIRRNNGCEDGCARGRVGGNTKTDPPSDGE